MTKLVAKIKNVIRNIKVFMNDKETKSVQLRKKQLDIGVATIVNTTTYIAYIIALRVIIQEHILNKSKSPTVRSLGFIGYIGSLLALVTYYIDAQVTNACSFAVFESEIEKAKAEEKETAEKAKMEEEKAEEECNKSIDEMMECADKVPIENF